MKPRTAPRILGTLYIDTPPKPSAWRRLASSVGSVISSAYPLKDSVNDIDPILFFLSVCILSSSIVGMTLCDSASKELGFLFSYILGCHTLLVSMCKSRPISDGYQRLLSVFLIVAYVTCTVQ